MKNKRKDEKKKYLIFAAVFFIALLIFALRLYWEDELSGALSTDCRIEYGYGKCIDGYLMVPFYNPAEKNVTYIKIIVPRGTETTINLPADFNINSPLETDRTGVLKLVPCANDIDIRSFSAEWCCGNDCYKTRMGTPNKNVILEVNE
jgi:hypothetical protein